MSLSLQAIQKHLEQQGIPSTYQDKMLLAQITIIPRILLYMEDHPGCTQPARSTGILLVIDHYGVRGSRPHQVRIIDHSPRLCGEFDMIHRIPTSDPQLFQKIIHIVNKAIEICRETTRDASARI